MDGPEVQPSELVTVNEYVPVTRPTIVELDPEPVVVTAPGLRVNVHEPAGKLLKTTLPVVISQEGCVMVPTTGAVGVTGCAGITTFGESNEVQPVALVTV